MKISVPALLAICVTVGFFRGLGPRPSTSLFGEDNGPSLFSPGYNCLELAPARPASSGSRARFLASTGAML